MKYLRLLLISIVAFFLVITAISLFFPSHIRVSRTIQIQANMDSVLTKIENEQNWKQWMSEDDSTYRKIDGISGIIIDSGQNNTISIKAEREDDHREFGWNVIRFQDNSITVQWYMDFHLKWYPWEKFSGLLLDKVYGTQMEKGLGNLKKLVENK